MMTKVDVAGACKNERGAGSFTARRSSAPRSRPAADHQDAGTREPAVERETAHHGQ